MFFIKPKLFTQFGEWTLVQTLDLISYFGHLIKIKNVGWVMYLLDVLPGVA
jgi:hypothetical protein